MSGSQPGIGRFIVNAPAWLWRHLTSRTAGHDHSAIEFMTPEHHRVRDFVVLELPRRGVPLTPEEIALGIGLPLSRVAEILDDLERHLTFVYRNRAGAVAWAYPVTVEQTPHRITLNGRERLYAA